MDSPAGGVPWLERVGLAGLGDLLEPNALLAFEAAPTVLDRVH
jgi:hypothetical protein